MSHVDVEICSFFRIQCQKLVKKTWMIVVLLETGANIDDVCSEINICDTGKPPVKAMETTNLTEYTMAFCTEWRRNKPDSGKFVSNIVLLYV